MDLDTYLAEIDPRLLRSAEGRRVLTRLDPLLFALTYVPSHLRGEETGDKITISEFHETICQQAKRWVVPSAEPAQDRDAFIGPRGVGKSTWFFLVLPLWAAAHGHRKFAAAFADSGSQAEQHLLSFKRELDTNELLRHDFPELCTPAKRQSGVSVADSRSMYVAQSGFVFGAKGIDASSLGMKIGKRRPDLIILDDIEPDESNYSAGQKDKRLTTLLDAVLPLNIFARVVLVGTVTMPESIVHELVKSTTELPEQWVTDSKFRVHYFPAILTNEDGEERSLWPAKWSLVYLESIRYTRDYAKNYANDPMGRDGQYWTKDDFTYGTLPDISGQLLSIDPAVTSTAKSDDTALAVIGAQRERRDGSRVIEPKKCAVLYAEARKVQIGEPFRQWVLSVLTEFPNILGILIETNQGGDTWLEVLHDIGVPITTVHNTIPKEVRAARLLARYQSARVLHVRRFPKAEGQMVGFPKAPHDDLVDAIGNGVTVYLGEPKKPAEPGRTESYV